MSIEDDFPELDVTQITSYRADEDKHYTHNIIVKPNSCSSNYIGVRVRLGLGFMGQRARKHYHIRKCLSSKDHAKMKNQKLIV
jgi:hypothetical protein